MERDLKLKKFESESMTDLQTVYAKQFPCQNIVRALLYLSNNTRPDIIFAHIQWSISKIQQKSNIQSV
jgi:hypothetical protein